MGTFEYDWIDYCLRWDGTSTPPSYMIEATYNGFDEDRMEIGYSEPGEEDAFVFHARIPVYNAWYNEMDFWKDEIDVDEVRMDDLVDRWRAIFR